MDRIKSGNRSGNGNENPVIFDAYDRPVPKSVSPSLLFGRDLGEWRSTSSGVSGPKNPVENVSYVNTCIRLKASSLESIRFYLSPVGSGGEEIDTGPVAELLRNPSTIYNSWELPGIVSSWLDLSGLAFFRLIWSDEAKSGAPTGIVPLQSWRLDPVTDEAETTIVAWVYRTVKGKREVIPESELLIWRLYNPTDPLRGLSPLLAAKIPIGEYYNSGLYNSSVFKNAGGPSGIYSTPNPLNDAQVKSLEGLIRARYSGTNAAGRPVIVHSGVTYSPGGFSPKDLLLDSIKRLSREEICSVLRVPPILVGILDHATYSNFAQASQNYWQDCIRPIILSYKRTWDVLARLYQPGTEIGVDTQSVEELQENIKSKIETAREMLGLGYTTNQVNLRFDLSMEESDWGDVPLLESNLNSFENVTAPPAGLPSSVPPSPESEGVRPSGGAVRKRGSLNDRVIRNAINKAHRADVAPIESKMNGKLRQYYRELQPAFIRRAEVFYTGQGSVADSPARSFVARFLKRFRKDTAVPFPNEPAMVPFMFEAIGAEIDPMWGRVSGLVQLAQFAGIKQVKGELPLTPPDLAKRIVPELTEYLRFAQLRLTQIELRGTLREALGKTLAEGLASSEPLESLIDRINATFKNRNIVQPARIAATETGMALNQSRYAALRESGIKKKTWITANDEAVRASHKRLDGVELDWNLLFDNGLLYPQQVGGPAAEVIYCRCTCVASEYDEPTLFPEEDNESNQETI